MFDLAGLLDAPAAPRGDRVAIVTNAGGLGVQCADACAAAGLRVAPLGEPAQRALEAGCRPARRCESGRPVRRGGAADYEPRSPVLADPGVDAVIVLFARSLGDAAPRDVARASSTPARPDRQQPLVLAVFMGADAPPLAAEPTAVPRFAAPEEAVRALRRALEHARRLARPPDGSRALAGRRRRSRGGDRRERPRPRAAAGCRRPQVEALLRLLRRAARRRASVATRRAARRAAAARLGGPVAVKALAPGLVRQVRRRSRAHRRLRVRRPSSAPRARCSTRHAARPRSRGRAGPAHGGPRDRAARRDRGRPALRAARGARRGRRGRPSWSATSRSGWRRSAPRGGRHDPGPAQLPAARGLPRAAASRHRRAARRGAARRRAGGRTSRAGRARLQPAGGGPGRRRRRRRPRPPGAAAAGGGPTRRSGADLERPAPG